nr:pre-mRNA-splicing factor syf2-like [Quercus suber]
MEVGKATDGASATPASAYTLFDFFNQKTLYDAYKKRTKNVEVDIEEYNRMKEADPEFYRDASSLQYGKEDSFIKRFSHCECTITGYPMNIRMYMESAPKTSKEKIDRMVKELKVRDEKRKSFSRRKFHEEKDIDSINDRNGHFNKKIERAFGRSTLEIKNSLERGTALPD